MFLVESVSHGSPRSRDPTRRLAAHSRPIHRASRKLSTFRSIRSPRDGAGRRIGGMTVEQALRALGGVSPTSRVMARGYSQYDIRKAYNRGGLIRPRRGWIAFRSSDPQLLFAAGHGVTLSCVTQAKRIGLWVLEEDRTHVAAPRGRKVDLEDAKIHRRRPLTPRPVGLLEDGIDNVLDCVAYCQPHDEALAVWDSALQKGLTDLQKLEALPLGPKARRLVSEATPFSDSGLETFVRSRMSWLGLPIRFQIWLHGHRVDILIGDRLVIQLDGRDHVGAQRSKDNAHDALLRSRDYTVLRFTYAEVVHRWPETQAAILDAIAHRLHLAPGR